MRQARRLFAGAASRGFASYVKVGEHIDWKAVTNRAANTSQIVSRIHDWLHGASTSASTLRRTLYDA